MIWRQVPSYPIYEASDEGQIRHVETKMPLITFFAGGRNGKGYRGFRLPSSGPTVLVHRLVCEAFHGRSNLVTDHIDGNVLNNSASNLQWLTPGENNSKANNGRKQSASEKINRGIANSGENSSVAVLTDVEVRAIKRHLMFGISHVEIAKKFKVAASTIGNIKQGNSWKHVK